MAAMHMHCSIIYAGAPVYQIITYFILIACRSLTSSSTSGKTAADIFRVMMSSVVTTMEATDWSVSLRMDTPTLQSKEPLVQAVLASCAVNLQWAKPETDKDTVVARYMNYQYHNSLGCKQPPGLDVNQSLIAQDALWPMYMYCMFPYFHNIHSSIFTICLSYRH